LQSESVKYDHSSRFAIESPFNFGFDRVAHFQL
jgi:hypothetical protein